MSRLKSAHEMNDEDRSVREIPSFSSFLRREEGQQRKCRQAGPFPGTPAVLHSCCAFQEIAGWEGKEKVSVEVT